ncbi:MAG TPA: alpha/beta hydrolase [Chloroflexia bacterium]|nr:alpha/beta hydrolase [Chloroflexia bacterium]
MERRHPEKIEVNGTELHYVERGEGMSVVFVHGGLGDFRTWLPQVESFSERYRAISYSRRAHYPNPWPHDYRSVMALHADDLAALIEKLVDGPSHKAHLVGNSYGAYICLLLALHHPELVRTLVLAEPPVQPMLRRLPGGTSLLEEFERKAWKPAGEAFARGDMEEGVRLFIEGAVGREEWEKLTPRVRAAMMKDAPEMAVSATSPDYQARMPDLTCEEIAQIEAPTFLLYGERSPRMYRLINDELARCLPHAEQATIPEAAHVLHSHNPEAHDRLVLDFLERKVIG